MDIPPNLLTATNDSVEINIRNENILWKIKGWAAKITYKMFVKYGDPRSRAKDEELVKNFAVTFDANFSIKLLEANLQILLSRKDKFVASKCLNHVLKFISTATRTVTTMTKLKPFVEQILY